MQQRGEFYKIVRAAAREVSGKLGNEKSSIVNFSRTTMQNLALTVGGFAGASFILLASPIPMVPWLLMVGIVILVFEVFWIFKYLFKRIHAETSNHLQLKENILDPLNQIITFYRKAEKGEIAWEEYDRQILPLNDGLLEQNRQGYDVSEVSKSYGTDNMDIFCTWATGIGLLFILAALLIPYLH